jgi:hypothetical protein
MARTAATPAPKFSWVIVTGIVAVFGSDAGFDAEPAADGDRGEVFPHADSRHAAATVMTIVRPVEYWNRNLRITITVSARLFALDNHQQPSAALGDCASPKTVDLP